MHVTKPVVQREEADATFEVQSGSMFEKSENPMFLDQIYRSGTAPGTSIARLNCQIINFGCRYNA